MTTYTEAKRFERPDGLFAVALEQADHGLWRFVEWKWWDIDPDVPQISEPFWTAAYRSGLYSTIEEAERAAIAEVPWLRAP